MKFNRIQLLLLLLLVVLKANGCTAFYQERTHDYCAAAGVGAVVVGPPSPCCFEVVLGKQHRPSRRSRVILQERGGGRGLNEADTTKQVDILASSSLSIAEATDRLVQWDAYYNNQFVVVRDGDQPPTTSPLADAPALLADAVRILNQAATAERTHDVTGRCMLGICASTAQQGIATLKSWVTALELPRGLLHGMDQDGVMLELQGSVYIKYNTGGSLTFADIRKSGIGFDALWKPGDALVELYDGAYRGVYFQVELSDGVFRQYLLPLDLFDPIL